MPSNRGAPCALSTSSPTTGHRRSTVRAGTSDRTSGAEVMRPPASTKEMVRLPAKVRHVLCPRSGLFDPAAHDRAARSVGTDALGHARAVERCARQGLGVPLHRSGDRSDVPTELEGSAGLTPSRQVGRPEAVPTGTGWAGSLGPTDLSGRR